MSQKNTFTLKIISQEKKLLEEVVEKVSLPTVEGEITILPHHAALLSKLETGSLRFTKDGEEQNVVIADGFVDVSADGVVTVLVDSAIHARDIVASQVQKAIDDAQAVIISSRDRRELMMAEASLRLAMLELRVAQKTKKSGI